MESWVLDDLVKRPWNDLPILDCGEGLVELKPDLHCIEPHPYLSLGAPYGQSADPWRLRVGVISRLIKAQEYLNVFNHELQFAIFDAWRPIAVQAFMIEYTINQQCLALGFDRKDQSRIKDLKKIVEEVEHFWASPTVDPLLPPPHSTGAAVDITLAYRNGVLVDMGGKIDEIGEVSYPNYFLKTSQDDFQCKIWHQRRLTLSRAMAEAGFVQHPNEWWHFSYGDQLWAWMSQEDKAIYGSCSPFVSNESTL